MTEITVGILGIGRLGEALAKAVLRHPSVSSLQVSRRNAQRVEALVKEDPRVQPVEPEQMAADCDYLIVALLPDVARSVLSSLKLGARHHVISVVAEVSHAELQALTKGAGSASRLLAMPSIVGGGLFVPMYPASPAAEALFGRDNTLFATASEKDFLALWSATGLLSAVTMVGEAAANWLVDAGIDREQANHYARVLFSEVYAATSNGIASGLEHVSTPGGLNAMTYQHLKAAGCDDHLRNCIENISKRLLASNKIAS